MTSQIIDQAPARGWGRPTKPDALTDAERQQRRREKVSTTITILALELIKAKKAGDWSMVGSIADRLLNL